jgi:hypothetical protein
MKPWKNNYKGKISIFTAIIWVWTFSCTLFNTVHRRLTNVSVSEDAGIELLTVAALALAVRAVRVYNQ